MVGKVYLCVIAKLSLILPYIAKTIIMNHNEKISSNIVRCIKNAMLWLDEDHEI